MFLCSWDQPSVSVCVAYSSYLRHQPSPISLYFFSPVNFKEEKGIVALLQHKFRCFLPCLSRESLKMLHLLCERCTKRVYELVSQKSLTPNELICHFLTLEKASVWWKSCHHLPKMTTEQGAGGRRGTVDVFMGQREGWDVKAPSLGLSGESQRNSAYTSFCMTAALHLVLVIQGLSHLMRLGHAAQSIVYWWGLSYAEDVWELWSWLAKAAQFLCLGHISNS